MLIPTVISRESSSVVPSPVHMPAHLDRPQLVTFADWLALPEERGAELIHGRIEYKAFPSLEHGRVQRRLARFVDPFDRRPGDKNSPGGWWIGSEVDVIVNGHGVRPDMAGWRRENHPKKPRAGSKGAIEARPDWVAEILSTTNPDRDLKEKYQIYQDSGVPYYWILNPETKVLLVHYKHPQGYTYVDGGGTYQTICARPFDAVKLEIKSLFSDDEDDE